MRFLYIPFITAVSISSSPVWSETSADIDTVIVTATRTEQQLGQIGQSVSVIDAYDIELSQKSVLSDLVARTPGVTFSRNGGPGTVTALRIRGAEADQTTVLIDGVKLNDPSGPTGGYNFGTLLIGNVERIEILRGSQSVLWGSQAIGGVVNMITREPTTEPAFKGHIEAGSFGTVQGIGNISGATDFVQASAGAGYYTTNGISAFSKERGGIEKDGFDNFSANAKVTLLASEALSFDLRGWYSSSKLGIDGFPAPAYVFSDTLEVSKTKEFVGYVGANLDLLDGRFNNRIAFTYTDTNRDSFNPGQTPERTFEATGRNERFEYQGTFDLNDMIRLSAGAETERSRMSSASPSSFDPDPAPTVGKATIDSIYGQVIISPLDGLTVTGGIRYDDHSSFGSSTVFKASASYSPNEGQTRLKASYGEGFKAPSLYQLQSQYGNIDLTPEESESWDVGIEQYFLDNRGMVGITYFTRDTTNQIGFASCFGNPDPKCATRPFGFYDNINRTKTSGVEVYAEFEPVKGSVLNAQYTYTDPRNRDVGAANFDNILARRARNTASVNLDHQITPEIGAGASMFYVGKNFDDAANLTELDSYVLFDVRTTYKIRDGIELYGRIENIFDKKYETTFQYGSPGRAAYAGLRADF